MFRQFRLGALAAWTELATALVGLTGGFALQANGLVAVLHAKRVQAPRPATLPVPTVVQQDAALSMGQRFEVAGLPHGSESHPCPQVEEERLVRLLRPQSGVGFRRER